MKYNAIITMHDNYDDAYISPYFDPSIIAKDGHGNLYKGWAWLWYVLYYCKL